MFLDANRPWRKVKVTARRTAIDFAVCMRELADLHYPKAERIRVVLDNLSTYSAGAFYQAFPAEQARRLLRRIELHSRSQARQLAQHGRDRDTASSPANAWTVASKAIRASPPKSPLLGEAAQWRPSPHRLELHNQKARTKMGQAYARPTNLKQPAEKLKPLCQGTMEPVQIASERREDLRRAPLRSPWRAL